MRWRFHTGTFASAIAALAITSVGSAAVTGRLEVELAASLPQRAVLLAQQPPAKKGGTAQTPPAAPAPAAPGPDASAVAAWSVSCSDRDQGKLVCEMTQNVVEARSRTQLVLLSVKSVAEGGSAALLMRVFHGVFLPSGIKLRIDNGQPSALQFQKSDQFGVYAALPLTPALLTEFRRGKEIKVGLEANKGEPLDITALLTGFGTAYDRVMSVK